MKNLKKLKSKLNLIKQIFKLYKDILIHLLDKNKNLSTTKLIIKINLKFYKMKQNYNYLEITFD